MGIKTKQVRAFGYALSLVAFQEVGMGDDKFLEDVRKIVLDIRTLCNQETGVLLETYPVDFLKENAKEIRKHYPFVKNFV